MSYPYRSKTLDRLGVRCWVNANNWSTVLGGTWIPENVLDAMHEVSQTFVDTFELMAKVDARIAQLCQVEDAHVVSGAGAAIELAVAGCLAGTDFGKRQKLPDVEDSSSHARHRKCWRHTSLLCSVGGSLPLQMG